MVDNVKVLTENGKMLIPKCLQRRVVVWYHEYLQQPGATRLEETLRAIMTWGSLKTNVQGHAKYYLKCQKCKGTSKKYGKVTEKLAVLEPWHTLCIDIIGPYTLKGKDKSELDFRCLIMINPVIGWFYIV